MVVGAFIVCLVVEAAGASLPEPVEGPAFALDSFEPVLAMDLNMTTNRQACLAAVQKYRPTLKLCAQEYQDMADKQAAYDSIHGHHLCPDQRLSGHMSKWLVRPVRVSQG